MDYIPIKIYRPRDLTKQQLAFCEAYLSGETPSNAARMAGYKSVARAGSYLLQTKRIKDYLNKREKQIVDVPVTFEAKAAALKHVVDEAIPLNQPLTRNVETGIKAIQELNKMQGHYAPTQSKNLNVNVQAEADREQATELFNKLLAKHKSEY